MSDFYLPIFRYQIGDPTTLKDGVICTLESGAMALDYHTQGRLQHWGGELERHQPDHSGGTDLYDLAKAWAYYGETLVQGTGGWAGVKAALGQGRAVILQGKVTSTTVIDSCQPGFRGGHAIELNPSATSWGRVGDPLCRAFHPVSEATVRAYAQALNPRVQFAVSAAHPVVASQPPPPVVPVPKEVNVKFTAAVYQEWTAAGTDGVLRATPARSAAITARLPAGTVVVSRGEAEDPAGNHWRLIEYPKDSRNPAWLLRYGPGVAKDHDFKAGAFVVGP